MHLRLDTLIILLLSGLSGLINQSCHANQMSNTVQNDKHLIKYSV